MDMTKPRPNNQDAEQVHGCFGKSTSLVLKVSLGLLVCLFLYVFLFRNESSLFKKKTYTFKFNSVTVTYYKDNKISSWNNIERSGKILFKEDLFELTTGYDAGEYFIDTCKKVSDSTLVFFAHDKDKKLCTLNITTGENGPPGTKLNHLVDIYFPDKNMSVLYFIDKGFTLYPEIYRGRYKKDTD